MKLQAETIDIESSGFAAKKFGVNVDDPQIIQILTQQIYNDPYVWPRELLANAADAGGAVELILPDNLNHEWVLEDHGPGMTDEFMETRYTAIFDSTKRDDNSKIGGFGHGRLSPLAYTDSFSVRSRFLHEGKVMEGNYVVFKGDDKIPQISRLSLGISDVQQTGVRVTVPVSRKDFQTIIDRTNYYGKYSKPTPPGIKAVEYDFVGSTGGVRKNFAHHDGVLLVMGGVPYPAPTNMFEHNIDFDLFFDVGELAPTLSRDSINATDTAKAKIRVKYNTLIKEYQADIKKRIDSQTTILDKFTTYQEIKNNLSYQLQRVLLNGVTPDTKIKGSEVFTAAKKDFALHSVNSDLTYQRKYEGMDDVTKTYKSLSALKVFMLTGRGSLQRRDGTEVGKDEVIDFTSFLQFDHYGSNAKINVVYFAVPMPYQNGQIKRIREVMAKTIGDLRSAEKLGTKVNAVLIQYEDKADAIAIKNMFSLKETLHFIDEKSTGAKGVKYIPTFTLVPAATLRSSYNNVNRKAWSENTLKTAKDMAFLPMDISKKESKVVETLRTALYMAVPSLAGKTLVALNPKDAANLPAGYLNIKTEVIKYLPTFYPYPYDVAAITKAISDREGEQDLSSVRYLTSWSPTTNKSGYNSSDSLGNKLLAEPKIQALPDTHKVIQTIMDRYNNLSTTLSGTDNLETVHDRLNTLEKCQSLGLFDKSDLPTPTQPFPTPTTGFSTLVSDFNKRYMMLDSLRATYNAYYTNRPLGLYDHIVEYIVKFAN